MMSAIHEALKRAQNEKDSLKIEDSGILTSHAGRRVSLNRRMVMLSALPVMIILLAFVSYSWLDSATLKASKTEDIRPAAPAAVPSPVVEADNPEACYQRAKRFQSEGDLDNARMLYQKVLRIDPGHVDSLNNLGVIYLQLRDFLAARNCFEKAIHLRPGYVEPHYNLACLYAHSGELEKSCRYLGQAVSLEPLAGTWALQDQDFQNLRGTEEFEKIVARDNQTRN